jgi:hypothetical protein
MARQVTQDEEERQNEPGQQSTIEQRVIAHRAPPKMFFANVVRAVLIVLVPNLCAIISLGLQFCANEFGDFRISFLNLVYFIFT